jgi:hypothetical protein
MTNRKNIFCTIFLTGMFAIMLCLGGCLEDASKKIAQNQDSHNHEQSVNAWIWVYQSDNKALNVYNAADGSLGASFTADVHSMMHIMQAGPASEPTLWMADGYTACSFTSGFHPHGDHAHMENPEPYQTIVVGSKPTHMGMSPDEKLVAFANDGGGNISVIAVETGAVTTVSHGSPHSAALLTDNYLITTHMQEQWLKIVSISDDNVIKKIEIGANAHGDAYYYPTDTAFIATDAGIEVIDLNNMSHKKTIPYTEPGRTNFLYCNVNHRIAIGLHKTSTNETNKMLVLDMVDESLSYVEIDNASLNWNIQTGQFALSANGKKAVISDMTSSKVYVIDVDNQSIAFKKVQTIPVLSSGVAVGIDVAGDHVWIMDNGYIYPIDVDEGLLKTDSRFKVNGGDWIHVTSFDGEVINET